MVMKEGFFPVVIGCSLSEIMLRDWNLILWGNRTLRNWHDDCELSDCLFFNELVTQYPCLQEPATGCCPVCSFYMVFFFFLTSCMSNCCMAEFVDLRNDIYVRMYVCTQYQACLLCGKPNLVQRMVLTVEFIVVCV